MMLAAVVTLATAATAVFSTGDDGTRKSAVPTKAAPTLLRISAGSEKGFLPDGASACNPTRKQHVKVVKPPAACPAM